MNLIGDAKPVRIVATNRYDAIVIGSGISGGWAAKELDEKGLKTLVLEHGCGVRHIVDYPTATQNPWEFPYRNRMSDAFDQENPIATKCYALDESTQQFFVKDARAATFAVNEMKRKTCNVTTTDQQTKAALFSLCQTYVQQRIDTARQAMEAAQEAANSESKSSAGDKYGTGRAMAQLERDRNAQLLAEAQKLSQDLARLTIDRQYDTIQPGSLVTTNRGVFFISISAGKLQLAGNDYFAVSPASPIATVLAGRKAGDTVVVNKLAYQVLDVA